MSLESRAEATQGEELLKGKVAGMGQGRVADRRYVPIGEDEPIALLPRRIFRVVSQNVKIERSKDVGHPQGTCSVPASGMGHHLEHAPTDIGGTQFKGDKI